MNDLLSVTTSATVPSPVGPVPHLVSQQPATYPPLQGSPVYPNQNPVQLAALEVPPASPEGEPDLSEAGRFAVLQDISHEEIASGRTRELKGNGSSFLSAKGLKRLIAIHIGNRELPLFEERSYPVDATGQRLVTVNEPLVKLDRRSDNTPVIIRALISNDGRWPAGVKIFVTGEWEDEAGNGMAQSPDTPPVPNHSPATQAAVQETDAVTRQQVYQDTGDARIAAVEGNAPVITDPVAIVHGTPAPFGAAPKGAPAESSAVETSAAPATASEKSRDVAVSPATESEAAETGSGKKRGR
jgi:hypothetical protein